MKIIKKMAEKEKRLFDTEIPTIAFLGDSVTQGCFELYRQSDGSMQTYFDKNHAYHTYVAKILAVLFPASPVNIINAGISGDKAIGGQKRLARDVLRFHPDLTVVSYGLNDSSRGLSELESYKTALAAIFSALKEAGSEIIFMTENMKNTYVNCHLTDAAFLQAATDNMHSQTDGVLDQYFAAAKEVANAYGVPVCDVYAKWKCMAENGVDTTALLANHINHPSRDLHWLFAYSLVETMMQASCEN